jgi:hypothetical protein
MTDLETVLAFLQDFKTNNPTADKAEVQSLFVRKFTPLKVRSVFVGRGYALRFSEAKTESFSNTVLSLSALEKHDQEPFVVVVVRKRRIDFLLANSTFLRKISHSSHTLRVDNIKGSFNGSDILTEYEGVPNQPEYFDRLFAEHSEFNWVDNLNRLVESTNDIVGRDNRFIPTTSQLETLLDSPSRAADALLSNRYKYIEQELSDIVVDAHDEIVRVAAIDNVNLRGNAIEQLVTRGSNSHQLGDLRRDLDHGEIVIDVKTKLTDRASAPKAYNIDKMLEYLAEPGTLFAFFMIAVDAESDLISTRLIPIFDRTILKATGVQHHWAGRMSRGVTQLSGPYHRVTKSSYIPDVDVQQARTFVTQLLNR